MQSLFCRQAASAARMSLHEEGILSLMLAI